jgi:hypothetical protein
LRVNGAIVSMRVLNGGTKHDQVIEDAALAALRNTPA